MYLEINKDNQMAYMFNRPGVAKAVLQTPVLLIKSLSQPFPPDIQQTFIPKPLKLGS